MEHKTCPHCGSQFLCQPENPTQCQCACINLTDSVRNYIAEHYLTRCLCTRIGTYTPIKNYWYPAMFLFPEDNKTSALPNTSNNPSRGSKIFIRHSQLLILRDGNYYSITGQRIE